MRPPGTEHPPPSQRAPRGSWSSSRSLASVVLAALHRRAAHEDARLRVVLISCNTRCMSHQVSMCWSQAIRASGFSMFFRRWLPSLSKGSTSRSRSSLPSCGSLPGAAATSAEGSGSSSGSGPSTTPWRPPREARPRSRAVAWGACGAAGATAAGSDRGATDSTQSSRPAVSLFNFTQLFLIVALFRAIYMGYPPIRVMRTSGCSQNCATPRHSRRGPDPKTSEEQVRETRWR